MNCPVCKDTELKITDRQGVEIDYCPKCRGVWLDRGELDKIIDRVNAQFGAGGARASTMPPPTQSHGHKDYERKPYKKKSILKEIFDF